MTVPEQLTWAAAADVAGASVCSSRGRGEVWWTSWTSWTLLACISTRQPHIQRLILKIMETFTLKLLLWPTANRQTMNHHQMTRFKLIIKIVFDFIFTPSKKYLDARTWNWLTFLSKSLHKGMHFFLFRPIKEKCYHFSTSDMKSSPGGRERLSSGLQKTLV